MSPAFAGFHDAFAAALYGDAHHGFSRQPGFAIHRNTVIKGCIDALQGNFPVVCRLTGEPWFREAAARYVRQHRPIERSLLRYGAHFADFLEPCATDEDLAYLPGVARLDHAWLLCHTAADEPVLCSEQLAARWSGNPAALCLRPRAAAWWGWFPAVPVYSIWDDNRRALREPSAHAGAVPLQPTWQGEGALLVRTDSEVAWMPLDEPGCAFLDACRAGRSLLQAALDSDLRDAALAALFARCLSAGVFAAMT